MKKEKQRKGLADIGANCLLKESKMTGEEEKKKDEPRKELTDTEANFLMKETKMIEEDEKKKEVKNIRHQNSGQNQVLISIFWQKHEDASDYTR